MLMHAWSEQNLQTEFLDPHIITRTAGLDRLLLLPAGAAGAGGGGEARCC